MATLEENIERIRTASKGRVVREAIASAIEQSDAQIDSQVSSIQNKIGKIDSRLVVAASVESISGDEYQLVLTPTT